MEDGHTYAIASTKEDHRSIHGHHETVAAVVLFRATNIRN